MVCQSLGHLLRIEPKLNRQQRPDPDRPIHPRISRSPRSIKQNRLCGLTLHQFASTRPPIEQVLQRKSIFLNGLGLAKTRKLAGEHIADKILRSYIRRRLNTKYCCERLRSLRNLHNVRLHITRTLPPLGTHLRRIQRAV
jgi:hypothetical protein